MCVDTTKFIAFSFFWNEAEASLSTQQNELFHLVEILCVAQERKLMWGTFVGSPGSGRRKMSANIYLVYIAIWIDLTFVFVNWVVIPIVSCAGMDLNVIMCIPDARGHWNPQCCHIFPASVASEVKISHLDSLCFFSLLQGEKRKAHSNPCPWNVPSHSADFDLKSCLIFAFCWAVFLAVTQQLASTHL